MRPLDRNVSIRLGHLLDEQMPDLVVYWRHTSRYNLFDFHFTRPARGQRFPDLNNGT